MPHPRKALVWLALPLLTACGSIVGSFVPPQSIDNPAGLNGAQLTSVGVLTQQTVGTTLTYNTSTSTPPTSFADWQYPSNVPFGMRPHAVQLQASFTQATVSGACLPPSSFQLTLKSFSAAVWDSGNQAGAATLTASPNVTVTATRQGVGATGTTYTLGANTVTAQADAATTERAITILTAGGTNDASASATITANDDHLAGCSIAFTLGNTKLTLSNFH